MRGFVDIPPVILLEGADGVGKSRLASDIAAYFKEHIFSHLAGGSVQIVHFGAPSEDEISGQAYVDFQKEAIGAAFKAYITEKRITIFDRLYLSTLVYSATRHSPADATTYMTYAMEMDSILDDLSVAKFLVTCDDNPYFKKQKSIHEKHSAEFELFKAITHHNISWTTINTSHPREKVMMEIMHYMGLNYEPRD